MSGILEQSVEKPFLRDVTMDDADLILAWVNDPLDRLNSRSSEPISRQEHYAWMERSLGNPNIALYIMVWNGQDVGHVKLYIEGDTAEIGYCIAPDWRGHGFANAIIDLMTEKVRNDFPAIAYLIGEVKASNVPSRKALVRSGYAEHSIIYKLDLDKTRMD